MKDMELHRIWNTCRWENILFSIRSPCMIGYGREVDNKCPNIIFLHLCESTGDRRERIDRIFFCAILEIYIALYRLKIVMSESHLPSDKWHTPSSRNLTLMELYITIVCIELTREKWSIGAAGREKEANLTSNRENFETKNWRFFFLPELPKWSLMSKGMMKCRKHFSGDEDSLLVGAVDADFIGDGLILRGQWNKNYL